MCKKILIKWFLLQKNWVKIVKIPLFIREEHPIFNRQFQRIVEVLQRIVSSEKAKFFQQAPKIIINILNFDITKKSKNKKIGFLKLFNILLTS